jgi:PhnB protein
VLERGAEPAKEPLSLAALLFTPKQDGTACMFVAGFANLIVAQGVACHSQKSLMSAINPWINFNGNAEEAFLFYRSVFGGEFTEISRFKDLASPEFSVAENEAHKIMRIALPVGANILIANDVPESMGRVNENENRSKIAISAESKEEADTLFNGLSAGGQVEMPMADSPWGSYFGMFRDKYGIEWTVNFDSK